MIETEDQNYIFIGHIMLDSITVKKGDLVSIGDLLGRCGNSGNSDFPHIHIHMQNSPTFNQGTGLNMTFTGVDVELSGQEFENVDWPLIRGLFVSNNKKLN